MRFTISGTDIDRPRLEGTDGAAKMSKSRGNTIDLRDGAEVVAERCARCMPALRVARGNPAPSRKIPGTVAENPVFSYQYAFDHDAAQVKDLKERYERTGVSNKELKDRLTRVINELLEPMRERRALPLKCGTGARGARAGHATRPPDRPGKDGDGA